MRRLFYTFSFLSVGIMLLGVGCINADEMNQNSDNTESMEKQNMVDTKELQRAYLFCFEEGYSTSLRFDPKTNKTQLFCIAEGKFNCLAVDFMKKTCPEEGLIASSDESLFDNKECTFNSAPVCGGDGYTYVNACIARLQKVQIIHEGQCDGVAVEGSTGEERSTSNEGVLNAKKSSASVSLNSSSKSTVSGNSVESSSNIPQQNIMAWVNILISQADHESIKQFTTIEQCIYDEKIVYAKISSCEKCLNVLYNEGGDVICYPGRKLRSSCPSYFDIDNSGGACEVIWRGR
jgi:hypothetical protein